MKVETFLPFFDYNDSKFDKESKGLSGQDYVNALEKEYNKSKSIVDSFMNSENIDYRTFKSNDGQIYSFNQKTQQNEQNVAYTKCSAIALDVEDNEETVDSLIEHFSKQEMFIFKLEFMEDMEEDFEIELNLWKSEHTKLNSYKENGFEFVPDRNGNKIPIDEWILANEPIRNVRISFLNKANQMVYAELKNCKIIDIENKNKIDLLVESMELIDNFVK